MTATANNNQDTDAINIDPNAVRMNIIRYQIIGLDDVEALKEVGRLVLLRLERFEGARPRPIATPPSRATLPERALLKLYLQLSPFVIIALPVIPFCIFIFNLFRQIPEITGVLESEVLLAALIGGVAAFMIYFSGRFMRAVLMRPAQFL